MNYYIEVLKKYATFSGRARRSEYWYFFLFNVIISVILTVIDMSLQLEVLSTIYSFAVLIPGIAVGVRRMHDVGKSGWFLIIPIYSLILAFTEGEKGPNQYGPDPKNPDSGELMDHLIDA